MAQPMTRPWEDIRERYVESIRAGVPLQAMLALVERIEQSPLRSLLGWTSMHDLCIVQTPVSYPYDGPYLRISPLQNGTIEFRYIDTYFKDKQWHRVVSEDAAFERLVGFTNQLHWFTHPNAASAS